MDALARATSTFVRHDTVSRARSRSHRSRSRRVGRVRAPPAVGANRANADGPSRATAPTNDGRRFDANAQGDGFVNQFTSRDRANARKVDGQRERGREAARDGRARDGRARANDDGNARVPRTTPWGEDEGRARRARESTIGGGGRGERVSSRGATRREDGYGYGYSAKDEYEGGDDVYDERDDDEYFNSNDDDMSDDEWFARGTRGEREWSREKRGYIPELLSKYVEDDFEPVVYTREPDDLDEYSFFSGARFSQLGASEAVRAALTKAFGIERPSHIQAQSYRVLTGESVDAATGKAKRFTGNVLLADQAGSGKTLAYCLPLLQRVAQIEAEKGRSRARKPRVLILTPTSELASQVREVIKQLSFGGLRSRSLLANNVSKSRTQIEALADGVDVVVGTPGRVARLIQEGKMETDDVDAVVLDECDVLLGDSFEFAEQVAPIRNAVPPSTQFILVTATIPDEVLKQLKNFFESDVRVVQGPGLHRPSAGMLERLIDCSGGDTFDDQSGFYRKFKALMDLIEVDKATRTLLFCNKIETCRKIENMLNRANRDGENYRILPYHAALSREQQQQNLKEFMSSQTETPLILVCTDRASRGLDASRVKHVILFDFPRDPSEYVRRVGRTARGALGEGRVSVLVLGRQVRLAREIMRRNGRGDPVEATPTNQ